MTSCSTIRFDFQGTASYPRGHFGVTLLVSTNGVLDLCGPSSLNTDTMNTRITVKARTRLPIRGLETVKSTKCTFLETHQNEHLQYNRQICSNLSKLIQFQHPLNALVRLIAFSASKVAFFSFR